MAGSEELIRPVLRERLGNLSFKFFDEAPQRNWLVGPSNSVIAVGRAADPPRIHPIVPVRRDRTVPSLVVVFGGSLRDQQPADELLLVGLECPRISGVVLHHPAARIWPRIGLP